MFVYGITEKFKLQRTIREKYFDNVNIFEMSENAFGAYTKLILHRKQKKLLEQRRRPVDLNGE